MTEPRQRDILELLTQPMVLHDFIKGVRAGGNLVPLNVLTFLV